MIPNNGTGESSRPKKGVLNKIKMAAGWQPSSSLDTGKGRNKLGSRITHGFSLVKGKANHPMEDYHVAEFRLVNNIELGLFAIFDGHLGHDVPQYLQSHLFENIISQSSNVHHRTIKHHPMKNHISISHVAKDSEAEKLQSKDILDIAKFKADNITKVEDPDIEEGDLDPLQCTSTFLTYKVHKKEYVLLNDIHHLFYLREDYALVILTDWASMTKDLLTTHLAP
ncbi:hypothetical protein L7F22_057948 [Adiantum nelumboides]|nr:hypothetical protein [Adiantum nelumboides]